MSSSRGLVTDTITFSNVDGPGNRFVIFLQGCSFNCVACHNPYTINVCIDCGECLPVCPTGSLTLTTAGTVRWEPSTCDGGDRCIAACRYDSTPKARDTEVATLVERIGRAAPFLSGVTISGGEATGQARFVAALFDALHHQPRTAKLTRFVDSNGDADADVWQMLEPSMDGAMIDLKALDPLLHARMTGTANQRVLASIQLLHQMGKLYEVRLLLIPGINDDHDLLCRTADWLAGVDPQMRITLIGFRRHGVRPTLIPLQEPTAEHRQRWASVLAERSPFQLVVV